MNRFLRAPQWALPSVIAFYYNRGLAFQELRRFDDALANFDKAIALRPDYPEAFVHRGFVLRGLKRYEEALAACEKAIELAPDYAKAYQYRGFILVDMGDMEEAEKMFNKALSLKPDFANAMVNLANIRKYTGPDHPDITHIKLLLNNPAISSSDSVYLNFALGKIYDDCGLYDQAFAHYKQGNQIRNKRISYNFKKTANYVNDIIGVFNVEFLARPFLPDNPSSPLFIVGMPRSGTTLTAQILSNHPSIATAGELPTISESVQKLPKLIKKRRTYPESAKYITPAIASRLTHDFEDRLRRDAGPDVPFVIDKHPLNFLHLGFIAMLFPKARIIHCMRDPMDTCLSNYFQRFPLDYDYAFDLQNIGHFYSLYRKLMAHWRKVLPLPMLEVHYEDTVSNTEQAARKMLDFLGLPWDERCLSHQTNPAAVETASNWQVRQPIYTRSAGRWQNYEKHLGPLKEALEKGD